MCKYRSVILTKGYMDEDWWEAREFLPAINVDGATAEFSGILDSEGNPIMKLPRPIGFGRDTEW